MALDAQTSQLIQQKPKASFGKQGFWRFIMKLSVYYVNMNKLVTLKNGHEVVRVIRKHEHVSYIITW